MRGALANVANVGQVRWTRGRCETGSNRADGQAVWSWHPDAGVKFAGSSSRRRWWLTSPVHQGEHGATVKPLRRECRLYPVDLVSARAFFLLLHARLRVHRASGIPCALFIEGARLILANLGRVASRDRGGTLSRRHPPPARRL